MGSYASPKSAADGSAAQAQGGPAVGGSAVGDSRLYARLLAETLCGLQSDCDRVLEAVGG